MPDQAIANSDKEAQNSHENQKADKHGPLAPVQKGGLHNNRQILDQLRLSIAMSLAGRVSAFVSPKPPTNIHPERFLAAVLVVLRDREYAKDLKRQDILETRRQQVEAVPFEV